MKPNPRNLSILSLVLLAVAVLPWTESLAQIPLTEKTRERFETALTAAAESFIGRPYDIAGEAEHDDALDNSHLFHAIMEKACQDAGIRYLGYAPMEELMDRTDRVAGEDLRIGDLIVLDNGLTAMVYKFENPDAFYMIYVSEKRQRVVSFSNFNVVFDVYWQKNLKGYYRLTLYNFLPNG